MTAPFAEFRLVAGSPSDIALRAAYERGDVGPFSARGADGERVVYEPRTRVAARVVRPERGEVLYHIRLA